MFMIHDASDKPLVETYADTAADSIDKFWAPASRIDDSDGWGTIPEDRWHPHRWWADKQREGFTVVEVNITRTVKAR